jgi:hypothetical protein
MVSVIHYCEILKSLSRKGKKLVPRSSWDLQTRSFYSRNDELEVGRVGKERREEVVFAC